jgi:hypothetical protein
MGKKDMKLETVDVNNIEIAEIKNWKGKGLNLDEKAVDETIAHFRNGELEPYITLDHNPGLTDSTRKFFKAMSLGYVKDLRKQGKKLIADFKQVPKLIAELIDSGTMKKRSIEFWKKFKHADGRKLNNVLEAVTFHGGNGVPAMNTLADIPKLFKAYGVEGDYEIKSNEHEGSLITLPYNFKQEDNSMTDEEKKEMSEMKAQIKKLGDDFSEAVKEKEELKKKLEMKNQSSDSAELIEMKSKVNEQAKALDEANKKLEEKEAAEKEAAEKAVEMKLEADTKEAVEFHEALVEAKKRLPKYKEIDVANYIKFKNDPDDKDGENFKLFKESLETADEVIDFGRKTKGTEDNDNKGELDKDSIAMKNAELGEKVHSSITNKETGSAYDDFNETAMTLMKNRQKTNPEYTFIDACEEINKISEGVAV